MVHIKNIKKKRVQSFYFANCVKSNLIINYIKKSNQFWNNNNIILTETLISVDFLIINFIKSNNFLLCNGDTIFDFNLKKIFGDHMKLKNSYITFLGTYANLPYGTILIKKGLVHSFKRDIFYDSVVKSYKEVKF